MTGTFGLQGTLPRLPIPTLEETMKKFPMIVSALETEEEQKETAEAVLRFLAGDGPELQRLLMEYDQEGSEESSRYVCDQANRGSGSVEVPHRGEDNRVPVGSYVEHFWYDAWLATNVRTVLNLNPFFVLQESPDPRKSDQILRAASLTFASIKYVSLLRSEKLAPDFFKGKPLCMDQFRALFGSCRVPNEGKDTVSVFPDSTHVAVMCRNQLFYFQALWPDGTVAVNEKEVAGILRAIHKAAAEMDDSVAARQALGVSIMCCRPFGFSSGSPYNRDFPIHSL